MDQASLRQLLKQVSAGAMSVDRAVQELRHLPFEDLGFAKVDHHRDLRTSIGEMIYFPGKTPDQRHCSMRCYRYLKGDLLLPVPSFKPTSQANWQKCFRKKMHLRKYRQLH
ncbi:MAG TPA: hypothetical protein VFN02_15875 [Ktedonobacteraceae bacterium]|nr:hypothetical protein [Ktedonobacteraceae bacterium]